MSHFIISCGGTGGHLSPGIALAEGLTERGHETRLLISQKKVDARLIEKYPQLKFERMPGTGFAWHPVKLARFATSQTRAFQFCVRLLRSKPTDAVIGFGGFTSAPLIAAARVLGIPSALHESNRVPGLAIRTLSRFANRVYLPPGITVAGARGAALRHVGLPVRREIRRSTPTAARQELGLDPAQRVLVVLGGSQGSSPLNDWTRTNVEALAAAGVQVYCVTGLGKDRETKLEFKSSAGETVRAIFEAFSDRVALLLSAADLVVSRAGAGTLAELIRCEAPAILVPFPQAADDHQRANAAYFEQQGGGIVVPQSRLTELKAEVMDVIMNESLLRKFRANLRRMDRSDALELIVNDLEEIASHRPKAPRGASVMLA